jgi:RNA polymerase sigma-70 factor (ECF subfamily)
MRIEEYDILFKKYYKQIFNYCRDKLRSEYASFDCVQEVFWILYQKINKVDVTENILIWLYRTADKVISRYIKKNSKDLSLNSLDENLEDKSKLINDGYEIIDTLVSKDELSLLEDYYLKGIKIREISEKLNISEAAIYKRIERLKAKIVRYGEDLL